MVEIFNFSTYGKKERVIFELKKNNQIQNDRTGSNHTLVHFCKNCKKVQIQITEPKKAQFMNVLKKFTITMFFSCPVTSFLTFFHFSEKCARAYHFDFYEILCSSIFFVELRQDDFFC